MREVLYRGRDFNGEWYYGYFTRHRNIQNKVYTAINTFDEKEGDTYCCGLRVVDETTVGQYTGLTDKNGKKIFDGDIIEYDFDDIGKQKAVVYWHEKHASFLLNVISENFQYTAIEDGVIIGNIFDNLNLLPK